MNEGDVIRFTRGSKQFAIPKGSYGRVEAIDRDSNVLTINTGDGRRIEYNPVRLFGVEVFREEQRVLARGERIQFRAPDRALGVANGEFATIKSIDAHRAVIRLDDGKAVERARPTVCATSITATPQLRTRRKARPSIASLSISIRDSRRELVNRKQFYVSISRARNALTIFTNDRSRLQAAADRTREKSVALEHQVRDPHQNFNVVPDEHRHNTLNQGHGLRR